MRPSNQTRLAPKRLDSQSSIDFFQSVAAEIPASERRAAILLLGGSDFRSTAVRRAQAALRFDLQPSYWSHAALLSDWPDGDPTQARGFEAAIHPEGGVLHEPKQNGVTPFALKRYLDDTLYPNLCVAVIGEAPLDHETESDVPPISPEWRETAIRAASEPNAGRPQFAFYPWLAEWIRFAMLPWTTPNPLLADLPHPGAAFIDYAYTAAGLDLVPSATAPNTAPEHLWATFLHWHEHVGERWGQLKVFARVKQPDCVG